MNATKSDFYVYLKDECFFNWFINQVSSRDRRVWQLEPPIRMSSDLVLTMESQPNILQYLLPACWNEPNTNRVGYLMAKLILRDTDLPSLTMAVDRVVYVDEESVNKQS